MDSKAKAYLNRYLSKLLPAKRNRYQKFDAYHFCMEREEMGEKPDKTMPVILE